MMAHPALLCCLAGLLLGAEGCITKSCTEMGCLSTGSVTGEISKPSGPIVVELCFNESCQQAKTDTAPSPGSCVPVTAGTIVASVCFQGDTSTGKQVVNGQLDLEHTALHDGDHYKLTIRDEPSGAVLGLSDQKVHYTTNYPNGPDCPGGPCKWTEVKVSPP